MKPLPTAYGLIGTNPVSLTRLTRVLAECPAILAWCRCPTSGMDLPHLAITLVDQMPSLFGVSIEDYIVKRWVKSSSTITNPGKICLTLNPSLELIETGKTTLTVPIKARIELVPIDVAEQIRIQSDKIYFARSNWKARIELFVMDLSIERPFHSTCWQRIAMPPMLNR